MRLGIDLAQARHRHMGVDLGGIERGVAQQLLHEAQVRTGVEQVGGVAVPQLVRSEVEGEAGQREIFFQHQLHLL